MRTAVTVSIRTGEVVSNSRPFTAAEAAHAAAEVERRRAEAEQAQAAQRLASINAEAIELLLEKLAASDAQIAALRDRAAAERAKFGGAR